MQEFDGTSWIGVVPFRMERVMRRPLTDLPCLSAFPELNVRLYDAGRRRGGSRPSSSERSARFLVSAAGAISRTAWTW